MLDDFIEKLAILTRKDKNSPRLGAKKTIKRRIKKIRDGLRKLETGRSEDEIRKQRKETGGNKARRNKTDI